MIYLLPIFLTLVCPPVWGSAPPQPTSGPKKIEITSTLISTSPAALVPQVASNHNESSCAKVALSAIYGAEKSYYAEFEHYSDSFADIGYVPEPNDLCETKWEKSIRVFGGGKEFLATAVQKFTGESWSINQKKELWQEREGK